MLNFQGAVYQNSVLFTHAPPLGWVSFPRKTWVSFNYKSISALTATDLLIPHAFPELGTDYSILPDIWLWITIPFIVRDVTSYQYGEKDVAPVLVTE